MRRTLITTIAGALLAVTFQSSAHAQQDVQNLALVRRLFLDREMVVFRAAGPQEAGQQGQILNNGDGVSTSSGTRAAIQFIDDGSVIRMNPGTDLQIEAEGERSALRKTLSIEF